MERHGFQDREHFTALIYSLGNCFAATGSKFDDKAGINKGYRISDLSADSIEKRNKDLADMAADIWHF